MRSARGLADRGRHGLILEVLGHGEHEHYRVRWDEEHESIFYPSGATGSSKADSRARSREFSATRYVARPMAPQVIVGTIEAQSRSVCAARDETAS